MMQPKRILVIKLSDMGDVLTATPALRALRETFRNACIDALVPPRSAVVLDGSPLVNEVLTFDKFAYDRPRDAFASGALGKAGAFLSVMRARQYDTLVLLHHLSTRWGAVKWAAFALAVGAPVRVGLDNGRGWFLTQRVSDEGFGAKHEVEHCLAVVNALGASTSNLALELPIRERDRNAASQLLSHQALPALRPATLIAGLPSAVSPLPHTVIAMHPGGGGHSLARRWPLDRWAGLGQALAARGARLMIVGSHGDGGNELAAQLPSALNFTGKTTLLQLAALLQQCDLFVGADSGLMHLATAVGVPVVALFGPTNPKAWGPWDPRGRSVVVQSTRPGCPCAYIGFKIRSRECEARECMKGIEVKQVLNAVDRLLVG